MSYLALFVLAVFLIKLPFIILGLIVRFSKPLCLVGFGCLLGVTLTAGLPDLSILEHQETAPLAQPEKSQKYESELSEPDKSDSPKLIQAALGHAFDRAFKFGKTLTVFSNKLDAVWKKQTEKMMVEARATKPQVPARTTRED